MTSIMSGSNKAMGSIQQNKIKQWGKVLLSNSQISIECECAIGCHEKERQKSYEFWGVTFFTC